MKRILLTTYGSRGDVEPMAALGVALQALGAAVTLSAPADPEMVDLLARAGVPLATAFMPVRDWVTEAMKNPAAVPLSERASFVCAAQYEALAPLAAGCDLILGTGLFPSKAAARILAEQLGIPWVSATYAPLWLPSEHHRPHSYPNKPLPEDETDNRVLQKLSLENMDATFGPGINAQRVAVGLAPLTGLRDWVFTDNPWLACDPVIGPWLPTDLCDVWQPGAWILPDHRPLAPELEAFLQAGPAPVYIGFGSMPMQAARDAGQAALAAVRAHGRRAVVLQGWAGLTEGEEAAADDVLVIGDVNQQALFPRVEAVIHHGGAGTTVAAARAGAAQVVVPQIADQHYWAARVATLGIGAHAAAQTTGALTAGLAIALKPKSAAQAVAVSGQVRTDGAARAARRVMALAE